MARRHTTTTQAATAGGGLHLQQEAPMTTRSYQVHPFAGGRKAKGITKAHRPLVWECMLGTVYASDGRFAEYFDYDWDAARAFAGVAQCTDLRLCKAPRDVDFASGMPLRRGRLALWGVPASATTSTTKAKATSTPQQRAQRRAARWRRTGVSAATVRWMRDSGCL